MSVSKLYLTEFPVEILEKVFMCLPGQDIIRMEVVRRATIVVSMKFCADLHDLDLSTIPGRGPRLSNTPVSM